MAAFIVIATALTMLSAVVSPRPSPSIYEVLESNGLPMGLLPTGITNFTIDPSTGRFEVRMDKSCDAKFETQVRFDWNLSGYISYGRMANLSGIATQDLFLWFPVKSIRVDIPSSGVIYFDVGVAFKQFSLSLFETPRDCTASDPDSSIHLVTIHERRDRTHNILQNESRNVLKHLGEGDAQKAAA